MAYTALMLAAHQGQARVVDLLRHVAELNLQDSNGHTALTGAAFHGHPAVVLQLLRAGADMALRTADGKTALGVRTFLGEVAASRGEAAAVEAGGAGAGSASGGEGGSSGPVPEETGRGGRRRGGRRCRLGQGRGGAGRRRASGRRDTRAVLSLFGALRACASDGREAVRVPQAFVVETRASDEPGLDANLT